MKEKKRGQLREGAVKGIIEVLAFFGESLC